jgi:hypothetical protein
LVAEAFRVAVVNYAPAALFLLIALATAYCRDPAPTVMSGLAGLALTFVAAAMQQAQVGAPRMHLSYNAVYHLLQAGALAMIYPAAAHLVGASIR